MISDNKKNGKRNVQKSMVHEQSCCFANQTYCFLTLSLPSASLDLKVPNVKNDNKNGINT